MPITTDDKNGRKFLGMIFAAKELLALILSLHARRFFAHRASSSSLSMAKQGIQLHLSHGCRRAPYMWAWDGTAIFH